MALRKAGHVAAKVPQLGPDLFRSSATTKEVVSMLQRLAAQKDDTLIGSARLMAFEVLAFPLEQGTSPSGRFGAKRNRFGWFFIRMIPLARLGLLLLAVTTADTSNATEPELAKLPAPVRLTSLLDTAKKIREIKKKLDDEFTTVVDGKIVVHHIGPGRQAEIAQC
eukprot:symbB.v1.2.034517.t1/scaffold4471.1/size51619/1